MKLEDFTYPHSVTVVHLDKDGNPKPIFQENRLFTYLINKGWLSPKAWKIPFLFGRWASEKEIIINGNN
ncbi:MAG: hypothetical protein M3362_00290 [Acidobacteriota bacterium]|nr:hypothetical protein [Acidobacteriota bacterium]